MADDGMGDFGGFGPGEEGDFGGHDTADMGGFGGFGDLGIGNPGSYGPTGNVGAAGFGGGYGGGYSAGDLGGYRGLSAGDSAHALGIGLPESYGGQTAGGLGFGDYGSLGPADFGMESGGIFGGLLGLFGVNPFGSFSTANQNAMGVLNNQDVAALNQEMQNPSFGMTAAEKATSFLSNALGKQFGTAVLGASPATGLFGKVAKDMAVAALDQARASNALSGMLESKGLNPEDYGYMSFEDQTSPTSDGLSTQYAAVNAMAPQQSTGQGGFQPVMGGETDQQTDALGNVLSPMNYQLTDFNNYQSYADKLRGSYG